MPKKATSIERSQQKSRNAGFRLPATLALLLVFLAPVYGFAQAAITNWHFGQNAWIEFQSTGPVSHPGSLLFTVEGSSSISDSTGQLLFYTDGITVWDKTNTPMAGGTGLNGNISSTQSALIVPCSCQHYFIFTTDAAENSYGNGLQYSVVNMTSSSVGVVSKNNVLLPYASEKIAAVADGAGGYWVVAHAMGNNHFYSWHVVQGSCRLDPTSAVVSPVGQVYAWGGPPNVGQGQMKISPDGSKLAVAGLDYAGLSFVELFSFNHVSGKVSNLTSSATTTRAVSPPDAFYGVEFSPDSQYLYATTIFLTNRLYQYTATPALSRNTVYSSSTSTNSKYDVGALQLGPDGNIYVARPIYWGSLSGQPYVSAIKNSSSSNPVFVPVAIPLAGGTQSRLGLPAMIAGAFYCDSCGRPQNPCPTFGVYDGANCWFGSNAPAGTQPCIWNGAFYYTPLNGNQCPKAGSWFDGQNCWVALIPPHSNPFVWSNSWYVAPACHLSRIQAASRKE